LIRPLLFGDSTVKKYRLSSNKKHGKEDDEREALIANLA